MLHVYIQSVEICNEKAGIVKCVIEIYGPCDGCSVTEHVWVFGFWNIYA
jgi:hypothetical protein